MSRTRLEVVKDADGKIVTKEDGTPLMRECVRVWPYWLMDPEFHAKAERWAREVKGRTLNQALLEFMVQEVVPIVEQHVADNPNPPASAPKVTRAKAPTMSAEERAKREEERVARKEAAAKSAAERAAQREAQRREQAAKAAAAAQEQLKRQQASAAVRDSAGDAAAQRAAAKKVSKPQPATAAAAE